MKLIKTLISAALVISACLTTALTAAATDSQDDTTQSGLQTILVGEIDEEALANEDPSYFKFLESQSKTGAVYGASDLTHASTFNNVDKDYGVDVSYYQSASTAIDWAKVKKAGIDFVIVRAGYRGYGNGKLVMDQDLYENLDGAIAAGLEVGVYFFTQAVSTAEAKEEAEFCIELLEDYTLDLPVYYDIEGVDYATGRLDSANLSKSAKTKLCEAFCDTMISNGFYSGVYTNKSWLTYQVDGEALGEKYPIWLAHYTTSTDYANNYDMWQYSGSGTVSGISTYVDMNVRYDVDHAPSGTVTLTNSGTTLSWNALSGATGYTVYSKDSSGTVKTVKTLTSTSYTVSSPSGLSYYVKAYFTYGGRKYYTSASNSVTAAPATVTGVSQTACGASSLTLSWDAAEGATGYQIYISTNGGTSYSLKAYTTSTKYSVTGLTRAVSYKFKVRAYLVSGSQTIYGSYSSVFTGATLPNIPSAFTVTSATNNKVVIDWEDNSGYLTGYEAAMYNKSTSSYTTLGKVTASNYTITSLVAGTNYSVVVRAYTKIGSYTYYSGYNALQTFKTAPGMVKNFSISLSGTSQAKLTWDSLVSATGYTVYEVDSSGTLTALATVSTNSYTLDLAEINVCVKAYTVNSDTRFYGTQTQTLAVKPKITSKVRMTAATTSSLSLTWNAAEGADSYEIYISEDGKTFTYAASSSTNSVTLNNLSAAKNYYIKARGRIVTDTGNIYGSYSAAWLVTTSPNTPSGYCVANAYNNRIVLDWANNKGECAGYEVAYYDKSTGTYTHIAYTDSSYYVLKTDAGVSKTVAVRAYVTVNGVNYYGSYADALLCASAPDKVTGLKVSYISGPNSAFLTWSKSSGANVYHIYAVYSDGTMKYIGRTETNSVTVSGMTSGKTYSFKVVPIRKTTANIAYGEASDSLTLNFYSAAPTGLSKSSVTSSSITLKWNAVEYASAYLIYKYNSATNSYTVYKSVSSSSTSVTVTGLSANTTYQFAISAVYAGVISDTSSVVSVKTASS